MGENNEHSGIATDEYEVYFVFKKTVHEASKEAAEARANSLAVSLSNNPAFDIIGLEDVVVREKDEAQSD